MLVNQYRMISVITGEVITGTNYGEYVATHNL